MRLPSGWIYTLHPKKNKVEVKQNELILCKNCKHFEYDYIADVNGVPLIVCHEICHKWGCKTREDGFCFLAEKKKEDD